MEKINLKVIQNDLIEKRKEVIYNGLATLFNDAYLHIKYREKDNTEVYLKINKDQGKLHRIGEAEVLINLNKEEISVVEIKSDVGSIFMESRVKDIIINDNNLLISYELIQGNNIVGKFNLNMEWYSE